MVINHLNPEQPEGLRSMVYVYDIPCDHTYILGGYRCGISDLYHVTAAL